MKIDNLWSEVQDLFKNKRPKDYIIGEQVKDGVNTRTYMGNNVWLTTLVHEGDVPLISEGSENISIGSVSLNLSEGFQNMVIGEYIDKPELKDKL